MRKKNNTGQNLTELAMCVMAIGMVFISMQLYLQRSVQARLKAGTDFCFSRLYNEAVSQGKANLALSITRTGMQYDPYYQQNKFLNETTNSDVIRGYPDSVINAASIRYGNQFTGSAGEAD